MHAGVCVVSVCVCERTEQLQLTLKIQVRCKDTPNLMQPYSITKLTLRTTYNILSQYIFKDIKILNISAEIYLVIE